MNAVSIVLLCAGIVAGSIEVNKSVRLPIGKRCGLQNCRIQNDTLIAIMKNDRGLSLVEIVGDSIVRDEELGIEFKDQWMRPEVISTPTGLACLYEGTDRFYLYERQSDGLERIIDTEIPLNSYYHYLIPCGSGYMIVYSTYSKLFTINSHSLNMEYGPFAYRRVNNGVISEAKPIESGRISNSRFQSIAVHDTVFAVWEQCKHESFLTWLTDIKISLVFASYVESDWSTPVAFYDLGLDTDVLGLFELNGKLYCLLKDKTPDGKSNRILYMKTDDRKHWSTPTELMRCSGFFGSFLASSDQNGRLHIVLGYSKTISPEYATFDGTRLEQRSQLNLKNVGLVSLAVDNGQPYLFYGRYKEAVEGDSTSSIIERVVTEEGDTVTVKVMKPDPVRNGTKSEEGCKHFMLAL